MKGKPQAGYIYLIGSTQFGWYKIGRSKNAKVRIEDLGILLPFKIEVFAIWETSHSVLIEALFHEKYEAYAINGEWFTFGKKELESVIHSKQPRDARRIFPGASEENSFIAFSNIKRDAFQPSWSKDEQAMKARLGAGFMDLVRAWLDERGMDGTRQNMKTARLEVSKKFNRNPERDMESHSVN